jgi:hypothetical protein
MSQKKRAKEDGKGNMSGKSAAPNAKSPATPSGAKAAGKAKTGQAPVKRGGKVTSGAAPVALGADGDRVALLAERRAKILERVGRLAARVQALQPREADDRFYDPDEFANGGPAGENVEAEVGWLPLDGRPR